MLRRFLARLMVEPPAILPTGPSLDALCDRYARAWLAWETDRVDDERARADAYAQEAAAAAFASLPPAPSGGVPEIARPGAVSVGWGFWHYPPVPPASPQGDPGSAEGYVPPFAGETVLR